MAAQADQKKAARLRSKSARARRLAVHATLSAEDAGRLNQYAAELDGRASKLESNFAADARPPEAAKAVTHRQQQVQQQGDTTCEKPARK